MTARAAVLAAAESEGWSVKVVTPAYWKTHELTRGGESLWLRFTDTGRLTDGGYRRAEWPPNRGFGWVRGELRAGVDNVIAGTLPETPGYLGAAGPTAR